MEPIPQKQPAKDGTWTLDVCGTPKRSGLVWEDIAQALDRLGPHPDSFVILNQEQGEDYWYIQCAVALAGPHTGEYTVECGWSGPAGPSHPGGPALVEWNGGYEDAAALFRAAWEGGPLDFAGFEDRSDTLPVNQRKQLLKITRLEVGQLGTNCYIIAEQEQKLAAVVDPGGDASRIAAQIRSQGLTLRYILLTHGHFDHVDGLPELAEAFPEAEIYLHPKDCAPDLPAQLFPVWSMVQDPQCPVKEIRPFKAFNDWDVPTLEAKQLPLGKLVLHPIHTPGHSEGSVTIRVSGGPLFCGDTLFQGSCGRTDFPGGNVGKMMSSLRFFGGMDGDAEVYPGHMASTTLEEERRLNPYLRQAMREKP